MDLPSTDPSYSAMWYLVNVHIDVIKVGSSIEAPAPSPQPLPSLTYLARTVLQGSRYYTLFVYTGQGHR